MGSTPASLVVTWLSVLRLTVAFCVFFRYGRLKWLRDSHLISVNRVLVNIVSALHIAPNGMYYVHEMLVKVSLSLVQGGESSVFSPMHLLLFKKPEGEVEKQKSKRADKM